MRKQLFAMTAGNNRKTAVLDSCIRDGEPDCQDLCFIRLGQDHALILMPLRGIDEWILLLHNRFLGWFDSGVLNRADVNFRAYKQFDHVQQTGIAEELKNWFRQVDGSCVGYLGLW